MYLSPSLSASLATLGRFLLGLVLLVAAIGKWLDRDQFARAVIHYPILPQSLARAVAGALPWGEFILAPLLILNWFTLLTASLTIGLLMLFTAAQCVTLARGQQVDCHCFGGFDQEKIGPHTLLRNAILMLIALWVLVFNWRYSAPAS
jgi:hypothetical protein